jgi:hypothetical protein
VVDATSLLQEMSIIVHGGDGMYFMAIGLKRFDKIHPEIENIPGGVQDDRNSHWALVMRTFANLIFRRSVKISDIP